MFNVFRDKVLLEFVRCKRRAIAWCYFIWYTRQTKKSFHCKNNILRKYIPTFLQIKPKKSRLMVSNVSESVGCNSSLCRSCDELTEL